jgi:hypothetical protein
VNGAGEAGQGVSHRPGLPAGLRLPPQATPAGLILVSEQRYADLIVAERRLRHLEGVAEQQRLTMNGLQNGNEHLHLRLKEGQEVVKALHTAQLKLTGSRRGDFQKRYADLWEAIVRVIGWSD